MKDWIFLEPIGDCDRYDCVIDKGEGLKKVQVKTGKLLDTGSIEFPVCSSHYHTTKGQHTGHFRRTYHGDVDYFGIYCFENDKCYLVPFNDVKELKRSANLRLSEPSNNQQKGIRWAKDYEI